MVFSRTSLHRACRGRIGYRGTLLHEKMPDVQR
jgi:hypothetical protein